MSDGVTLTPAETLALALSWLLSRADRLEWEDVPLLTEDAATRLLREQARARAAIWSELSQLTTFCGIDIDDLKEKAGASW